MTITFGVLSFWIHYVEIVNLLNVKPVNRFQSQTNAYMSLQINVHSECNLCNECVLPIIFTVFLQLLIYLYIDCDLMNLAQSI